MLISFKIKVMKHMIKYLTILLAFTIVLNGCEESDSWYGGYNGSDYGDQYIQVVDLTPEGAVTVDLDGVLYKSDDSFPVNVRVLGTPRNTETKVTVKVVESTATEGVEFAIPQKEFTIPAGELFGSFNVDINYEVIDLNTPYTVSISIDENGTDLPLYTNTDATSLFTFEVKLHDDFHPLNQWIGTYSVAAASYGSPGDWDEAWTVTVASNPDDETKTSLIMTGIGKSTGGPVIAKYDMDAMTISIESQTITGNIYGYGDIILVYGNADLTVNNGQAVVGTISANGDMSLDNWGHLMTGDNAGAVWDVFNTTWTKQ